MNFNALVIKVASRCNLNCSYCFMYNMGDSSYKKQPKFISEDCVDAILEKTVVFLKQYPKKTFTFLFHGGEPLLIKKEFYLSFVEKARKINKEVPETIFKFHVQSNGVLFDEEWSLLFRKLNIIPSISIDGTEKAHDMNRVDHKGNGSYQSVRKGVKILKEKFGFLEIACVINTKEDPIETYKIFKEMQADSVNFLMPDYTHDNFPIEIPENTTEMADWLIKLFDHWIADKKRYGIIFFNGLVSHLLGIANTKNEDNEAKVLVIETNGEIEAIDSLKICGEGFTKSNMNIKTHQFTAILETPLGELYYESSTTRLSRQCLKCPIKDICKGGRLVHRFKKENGFNNPSIYCKDLIKVIAHIQNRLITIFPETYKDQGISALNAKEIIKTVVAV